MSAPDTNIEKQRERHKPALWGVKGAMIFGALMLVLIVVFAVLTREDSEYGASAFDGDDAPAAQESGSSGVVVTDESEAAAPVAD